MTGEEIWNQMRRTLFAFLLFVGCSELIITLVLSLVLRPNTLDIDTLHPRSISKSDNDAYGGDLFVRLELYLSRAVLIRLGRNEAALAFMTTIYMALTIYVIQTTLSTNWSENGVPLAQILAMRAFEDPLYLLRSTTTYRALAKHIREGQRAEREPFRRPMKLAIFFGHALAFFVLALNVLFTYITIGENRQLLVGGMDSGSYSIVELLVNVPKFGGLNTNIGTRGCQLVPILTDSLGGHERLNELVYCTNIVYEGAPYIPLEKAGGQIRNISTSNLESEAVYRSDMIWPGLGPNLAVIPPKECRGPNKPLAFITANPSTKKLNADVQVEFSKPSAENGMYKFVSQSMRGRQLYNLSQLSDDWLRKSQLSGQIISSPCIEWLEASAQGLLNTIQVGLVPSKVPKDTLEFNAVSLRSRAALALIIGLSTRALCCVAIFLLHHLYETRQVDEIIDIALTASLPDHRSQPLMRQPARRLFIGLALSGGNVEVTMRNGEIRRIPLAHLRLCTEKSAGQQNLGDVIVDGQRRGGDVELGSVRAV